MNLDGYLRRIAWDGPLAVDATTLAKLQRAHLLSVPFENLDIGWGEPIGLDVARHYEKIVARRRGGFCYEQNHLFAWALEAIGFRVSLLSAAVWGARDGADVDRPRGFGDDASHVLLRVDLDEPWLADVAFGENFRIPMPMVDGFSRDEGARSYRLDRDGATWTMSTRDPQKVWAPSYRFDDVARSIGHFAAMCRFHQTSPRSPFTQKRLCSLATADGRVTLSGDEWIVSGLDGSRRVTAVASEAEAADLLRTHFGIATPARAA